MDDYGLLTRLAFNLPLMSTHCWWKSKCIMVKTNSYKLKYFLVFLSGVAAYSDLNPCIFEGEVLGTLPTLNLPEAENSRGLGFEQFLAVGFP